MKTKSTPQALNAALTAAGFSLENLRSQIESKAAALEQFKPAEGCGIGNVWIRDIIVPEHEAGESWHTIITCAGKNYECTFTIDNGTVTLSGATKEVIAQTEYTEPPAADKPAEIEAASRHTPPATRHAALEAGFSTEAPDAFDAFMVMPAGIHTVTLGRLGKPHQITVNVNKAGALARQAHLEAVNAACKLKAYNCFDHQKLSASSHPVRFWWEDGRNPDRPAGIYEQASPTSAGLDAVSGKVYQGWSETFYVDNEFATAKKPAQLINPLEDPLEADGSAKDANDYRVFGTLTNRPAFTTNEPLFAAKPDAAAENNSPAPVVPARPAGAHQPSSVPESKHMKKVETLDAAALQARCEQLEQDITALEAKSDAVSQAELRASRSELDARRAEMELAVQRTKITELEAAEVARLGNEADRVIQIGMEAAIVNPQVGIPQLDKKAQKEWRDRFVANPSLMPAMEAQWKNFRPTGRTTMNAASHTAMGYGAVKDGANMIISALNAEVKKQMPIRGLDASSNEKRTEIAKRIAMIWANDIRTKELDAEGNMRPGMKTDFLLAPLDAAVGLDAATDADGLGTLAGTFVTQRFLDIFMYKLPLISRIMTDFSDQPSDLNQAVSTRKIVVPGIVSFDNTLDTDGYPKGWAPAAAPQTTDVNITLDELIGVPIQYDLATLSSTQRSLFMEQAPAAAYAVALYFMKKIYAVCTAANFAAYAAVTAADANGIVKVPTAYATYPVALIDFARSKISDVAAAFDANEVPDEDRTMLLNAPYYNKACNDPSLVTFFAGQQSPEIVTGNRLPNLAGFAPIKAPNFPGTNNRFGMFLQKNGLLAKSRLPNNLNQINPGAGNGSVGQIVHPETGLAMLLTQWTDHKRGYSAWNPCAIIGAAKGDTRGGLVGTTQ